uniref:Uncharacterized protein n=1 Tax=Rhizophora mucronata TaxID=61149 RepID=A0A2P2IN04_RHIMU
MLSFPFLIPGSFVAEKSTRRDHRENLYL